jgi:hypothetical protein
VLGNVFMWSNSVFYPDYAAGEAEWEISPLTDQSIAGVIMTVEGGFVTLGCWHGCSWSGRSRTPSASGWSIWRVRGPAQRRPRCRAAASGQGARLEERIKESH